MNAFYKVKLDYYGEDAKEHFGVAVGDDEGHIMNKVMDYYGRDNVEQIAFWFGENCQEDVVEYEDFHECSLFDFK